MRGKHPVLRLLENPGNRGKGYSVRNGMLHARGDILLFSDADLSSPIEEADKLFAAIADGADIAIGSRWLDRLTADPQATAAPQILRAHFQSGVAPDSGLAFQGHAVRFQGVHAARAQAIFPLQKIERWGFDPELLYLARNSGSRSARFRLLGRIAKARASIPCATASACLGNC